MFGGYLAKRIAVVQVLNMRKAGVLLALVFGLSAWSAAHGETPSEALSDVLSSYATAANDAGASGMSLEATAEWVGKIERSIVPGVDPELAQVAYGAVIGLWNWHKEWDLSILACDQALLLANSESLRLVRLVDKYAIEAARGSGNGDAAEIAVPVPSTADRIRESVRSLQKGGASPEIAGIAGSISSVYQREW